MRAGGAGVVAEGNEAALAAFLTGEGHGASLVETYDRRQSSSSGYEDPSRSRDEVTGLPRESGFLRRLGELGAGGEVPRVAFARVLRFEHAARRLSAAGADLVRRRLALQYQQIARAHDVELFALGSADFGLLSETLSPHRAERLGLAMAEVTETFAPAGNRTLCLALGHAGPEVTTEPTLLRELAQRALVVAAAQPHSAVVGAEALSLGVSSTTELETAIRLLDFVERHDGHAPGHGARVAETAAALGRVLGVEGPARSQLPLAAHRHDIGKVGLPVDAMAWREEMSDDDRWSYRAHPVRGADYLRVSAGPEVAEAVRAHHEHWDGNGFPDGMAGEEIPLAARILAVADRMDDLRTAGPADAVLALSPDAGSRYDPAVVAAVEAMLAAGMAEAKVPA